MTLRSKSLGLVLVVSAGLVVCGCLRGPSRVNPPSINASAAGTGAMAEYDTNGDGKVDGEELEKAPSLKAALEQLDTDSSGGVSAAEVTARVQNWQDSKLGLMGTSVVVNMDGSPLDGAKVHFAPEKFLGENVQVADGETDENGVAMLTIPEPPEPTLTGVAPGLYRVEITHDSMTIPAKYNTETTLGQEIAQDAEGMNEGITFELSSK